MKTNNQQRFHKKGVRALLKQSSLSLATTAHGRRSKQDQGEITHSQAASTQHQSEMTRTVAVLRPLWGSEGASESDTSSNTERERGGH